MSNEKVSDEERVRAVMDQYVDDEYLASQLGLEDALIQMCDTIRQEARAAAFREAIQIAKEEAFERRLAHTVYERLKLLPLNNLKP